MPCVSQVIRFVEAVVTTETFWIAVGAVGTVATLFFIQRQLRHARYVSAYEFLRREDDRFRTDEMHKHRSELAAVLLLHPTDFRQVDEAADFLTDYFEDLGLILRKGLTPGYLMWSMNCYYVLRYWHVLLPYVNWVREKWDDPSYYSDFEYLCRRIARIERRMSGRKVIALTDSELRDFLQEELSIVIRLSAPSDLTEIMRIEKEVFKTDDYPESQFRELRSDHPDSFFIAELQGSLVGYGVGYVSDQGAELDSVAVDPRYRKLGVGKALVGRLLEYFRNQGAVRCSLEVRTSNVGAIKFYERLGFQIMRTAENYYADGGNAYVMEMPLTSMK